MDNESIDQFGSPVQLPPIHKKDRLAIPPENDTIPHDIDFVGTGSFQVSQHNVLYRRSLEPLKSSDAQLSARGKSHRSREHFAKDAHNTSAVIATEVRRAKRLGQDKPSAKLLLQYFQRALALERLKKVSIYLRFLYVAYMTLRV